MSKIICGSEYEKIVPAVAMPEYTTLQWRMGPPVIYVDESRKVILRVKSDA